MLCMTRSADMDWVLQAGYRTLSKDNDEALASSDGAAQMYFPT